MFEVLLFFFFPFGLRENYEFTIMTRHEVMGVVSLDRKFQFMHHTLLRAFADVAGVIEWHWHATVSC